VLSKNLWPYNQVYKKMFGTKTKKGKFAVAIIEIENESGSIETNLSSSNSQEGSGLGAHGEGMAGGTEEGQKAVGDDMGQENQGRAGEMKEGQKATEKENKDGSNSFVSAGAGSKGSGKKKGKVLVQRDTNKHLQEDEARNLKLFREKIVEDGKGFTCNSCEFVSGIRIVAKTHAVNCDLKQQKRRKRSKVYNCTECEGSFDSKRYLDKHFRTAHVTSSYNCSTCGYKNSSRRNYMKHLRSHDKKYSPGFKCDFCSFRAKDTWHLDKHTFSHFKNTNAKSLNGALSTFCPMSVGVCLTEFQVQGLCNTVYQMTISKNDGETPVAEEGVDWNLAADEFGQSFSQLGLTDSDWEDWLQISSGLGLGPFENFMSWVSYSKEGRDEVFRVCVQEKVDKNLLRVSKVKSDFIDTLFNDICGNKVDNEVPSQDTIELCRSIVSDVLDDAFDSAKMVHRPSCEDCGKTFKDKHHLSEHKERMHTDPTLCSICNEVFQDKFTATSHQKTCIRKCPYSHCSFQIKHKHKFLKHIRGHEMRMRRF
jgi:hypothetical protein